MYKCARDQTCCSCCSWLCCLRLSISCLIQLSWPWTPALQVVCGGGGPDWNGTAPPNCNELTLSVGVAGILDACGSAFSRWREFGAYWEWSGQGTNSILFREGFFYILVHITVKSVFTFYYWIGQQPYCKICGTVDALHTLFLLFEGRCRSA